MPTLPIPNTSLSAHTRGSAIACRSRYGALGLFVAGVILLVSVRPAESYEAQLTWRGVPGATAYRVYTRITGEPPRDETVNAATASGSQVSYVIDGLPLGPTAYFTVTALDDGGRQSLHSNQRFVSYPMVAQVIDSDSDGLTDAEEDVNLNGFFDPGETDSQSADTDGDGWSDGYEREITGTDPLDSDSDNDGIMDGLDTCHDIDGDGFGATAIVGTTCPVDNCINVFNPAQSDDDADGRGEACDPCTNIAGDRDMHYKHLVVFNKIYLDPKSGNDQLTIKGDFTLREGGSFLDLAPGTDGVRIVVANDDGVDRLDITVPAEMHTGARKSRGWRYSNRSHAWKYVDRTSVPINGLRKLLVKDRSKRSPGEVRILLRGRNGHYPVTSDDTPMRASVVLGDISASLAGDCGESAFVGDDCFFNRIGRKMTCVRKD